MTGKGEYPHVGSGDIVN